MRLLAIAFTLSLASAGWACAKNPATPSDDGPPSSVVKSAFGQMINGFTQSINNGLSSKRSIGGQVRPQFQVFVQPPDERRPCPRGGYISTSGTMSGTLSDATGTGQLSWTSYQSFVECSFDDGWTLRSNPYETFGGTITINTSRTSFNIRVGGGGNIYRNDRLAGTYYWNSVLLQWDSITGWSNSGQFCATPGPVCAHF